MGTSKKQNSDQTERKCCVYTENDKAALVNLLVESCDAGLQSDNNFKSIVWTKTAALLNQKLTAGHPKTADSCKQQYAALIKTFRMVKELRDKSGFGWDDDLKKPTATEGVWAALVNSNSRYRPFSRPGFHFPLYDEMERLSGGSTTTGEGAYSISTILNTGESQISSQELDVSADEIAESQQTGLTLLDNESDTSSSPSPSPIAHSSQKGRKRAASPEPNRTLKRRNSRPSAPAAISSMADAICQLGTSTDPQTPKRLTEAIRRAHRDDTLTITERAKLMKLFTDKIAVADAYLAFDEDNDEMKESRTEFVRISID
ncbi:hypothetical protein ACEPAH_3041 [Sanghuangporus vaninii]